MKYCKNCGYKIVDLNLKFCPECGAPQNNEKEPSNEKYDTDKQKILIDYFERTVGTPEKMPYYELVLYTYDDRQLILEEYTDGGSSNERCAQFLVPFEAYEKATEIVKTFSLKELLGQRGVGLDGMMYVIKFRESLDDENLYSFSAENVGEDQTMMMFPQMKKILSSYTYK